MPQFKKIKILLFFLFICNTTNYAQNNVCDTILIQTDTSFNVLGIPHYYYVRTFEYNREKPTEMVVTFVFTTQKNQAITYRQETLNGQLTWINKEGLYRKENIIEAITTNLPPHSSVIWKYRYTIKAKPANKIITFDRSAILLMNDNLEVKKIVWEEKKLFLK